MKVYPEEEIRKAWDHVLETRERIARGEADWGDIADHFTEDGVYIDPVWGRYVGREAIRTFIRVRAAQRLAALGAAAPDMADVPRRGGLRVNEDAPSE